MCRAWSMFLIYLRSFAPLDINRQETRHLQLLLRHEPEVAISVVDVKGLGLGTQRRRIAIVIKLVWKVDRVQANVDFGTSHAIILFGPR